jgi:hypothetical protein
MLFIDDILWYMVCTLLMVYVHGWHMDDTCLIHDWYMLSSWHMDDTCLIHDWYMLSSWHMVYG